jgi:hypothetical protein
MINFEEAWRQLGYTIAPTPPPASIYTAAITDTGWYNIDKAVTDATIARTTLNYTSPAGQDKVTISYLPVSFNIPDWQQYDRLYVYLLPDQLSSFMRIAGAEGSYNEKLNALLKYDLVCLAYKGDQIFFYHQQNLGPKAYTHIQLSSISQPDLKRRLNEAGSIGNLSQFQDEDSFYQFDIKDQPRRKHNEELAALRGRLINMIFPCIQIEAK